MYSQAPLLKLLSSGKIPGESGVPEHIETVISNVFLFKDRAYKVYKNDNDFFNKSFHDLSTKEERLSFSAADFDWNKQLAREIYLHLQGVKVVSDEIAFTDADEAEELIQINTRMPSGAVLFDHLQKNDLEEVDFYEIGKQFAMREKAFVWHGEFSSESTLQNIIKRHTDIIEWVKDAEEYLPAQERNAYSEQLLSLIKEIYTSDTTPLSIGFDFHSFNAFYVEGVLYPFDTHPPKDAWRFCPTGLNVYRLATDVFALVGEKEFRAVIQGYFGYLNISIPNEKGERLFVMYAALIMVSYLYMLARTDSDKMSAAIKYHEFLRQYAAA